jgi:hypothetical protein
MMGVNAAVCRRHPDGGRPARAMARMPAGGLYDAVAAWPMPHEDVHYERENAFID